MKAALADFWKQPAAREKAGAGVFLLLGFVLRLRQYLTGRSLWLDEAMLALNIVNRDFAGLFKPLDYDQGAPIGFLLIEKLFNALFGRNELVLRFIPFLAGTLALWLFYLLLKQLGQGPGPLIALALFAVNPQLVYYSSESKQYIIDVAVALALLVLALPLLQHHAQPRDQLRIGLAGLLALWLSHPALFTLAGIGLTMIIRHLQHRDLTGLRRTLLIGGLWLANLAVLYVVSLRNLNSNPFLKEYWAEAFLPVPPWSDTYRLMTQFTEGLQFQFEIQLFQWLLLAILVLGWLLFYRDKRGLGLTFGFTYVFAFLASALRLYPVGGRLSLFLIPFGICLLGKTVHFLWRGWTSRRWLAIAVTIAVSTYLIYSPLVTSLQNFVSPKYFEHIRPYMDYLATAWKDGDSIFVSYWAEPAFRFYTPFYGLEGIEYQSSAYADYSDPQLLTSRLEPLAGQKRVWVLFSHVYERAGFNEKDFLVQYLDAVGKKTREFHRPNTSVYLFLYDLSLQP